MPRPVTQHPELNRILQWNEEHLKTFFWRYIYGLGIGQNWEMFASVDANQDQWFTIRFIDETAKNQLTAEINIAHPSEDSLFKRLSSIKNLFMIETLAGTQSHEALNSILQYHLRNTEKFVGQKKVTKVQLVQYVRPFVSYIKTDSFPQQAFVIEELKHGTAENN